MVRHSYHERAVDEGLAPFVLREAQDEREGPQRWAAWPHFSQKETRSAGMRVVGPNLPRG